MDYRECSWTCWEAGNLGTAQACNMIRNAKSSGRQIRYVAELTRAKWTAKKKKKSNSEKRLTNIFFSNQREFTWVGKKKKKLNDDTPLRGVVSSEKIQSLYLFIPSALKMKLSDVQDLPLPHLAPLRREGRGSTCHLVAPSRWLQFTHRAVLHFKEAQREPSC